MPRLSHLAWPFFSETHRQFGPALADWASREIGQYISITQMWTMPITRSSLGRSGLVESRYVVEK